MGYSFYIVLYGSLEVFQRRRGTDTVMSFRERVSCARRDIDIWTHHLGQSKPAARGPPHALAA